MKLIFDASTEYESLTVVVDLDIDGLKSLKTKIGIVRKALPDAVRVAFQVDDLEVHQGVWDEGFDPSEDGDVHLRWSHVVVSGGSISWEFCIKHVDGSYEAYGLGETDLDDLIKNPRDVWYDDRIQDEIDWEKKK